jgi:hypothetical protein
VRVYNANAVRIGHVIAGPALVDNVDTTLWAPPDSHVELVSGGSLVTRFGEFK